MAAGMDHAPPGFRFTQTRKELITFYLDPWVADPGNTPVGETQGIACVTDGNRSGGWASRAVNGGGTWHGYGKRVPVAGVGHRQTFEYRDARGRKTAWLMEEFGTVLPAATDGDGVRVLCRVHQTTRTAAVDDGKERGESSKAAHGRSSKRRRRGEQQEVAADAKDEQMEPLEQVIPKDEPEDEPEAWEMVTMEDDEQHFEAEQETWEILAMEHEPEPEPEPLDTLTQNMPGSLEILTMNSPQPLEIITKEDGPEPLDAEAVSTATTALDQDSGAANKEATSNAEMGMPADAEWNYPELFVQREPPPMEDIIKPLLTPPPPMDVIMKPVPAPPLPMEDIMKPLPAPTAKNLSRSPLPAVQEFGVASWGWGGHGRRCLVRPTSLSWILPSF
ncbi:hypothetical protein ZWY2020_026053 [Hordeum vulgare]|nr:hypothetical protein ZWY2020_026053 [Hordeum vulgare]